MNRISEIIAFAFSLLATASGCKKGQVVCSEDGGAAIAPTATATAIPLDQPKAARGDDNGVQTIAKVTLLVDGSLLLNGKTVTETELRSELTRMLQTNPELRAVINADAAVTHGRVIHVLDLLKQSGVAKIAFGVVAPPEPTPIPMPKK